jgi:hypothetical protein
MNDDQQALLVMAIREEIQQLRKWASESMIGGWSTHQVEPMRKRADQLEHLLLQMRANPYA